MRAVCAAPMMSRRPWIAAGRHASWIGVGVVKFCRARPASSGGYRPCPPHAAMSAASSASSAAAVATGRLGPDGAFLARFASGSAPAASA